MSKPRSTIVGLALCLGVSCSSEPPPGQEQLTIKNYLSWCSVSVNGGTASATATQVVNVDPGVIALSATPLVGFELGATPWHETDGDNGSGDPGTRAGNAANATVTVGNAAACAWVCCQTAGANDCPATNQCL